MSLSFEVPVRVKSENVFWVNLGVPKVFFALATRFAWRPFQRGFRVLCWRNVGGQENSPRNSCYNS